MLCQLLSLYVMVRNDDIYIDYYDVYDTNILLSGHFKNNKHSKYFRRVDDQQSKTTFLRSNHSKYLRKKQKEKILSKYQTKTYNIYRDTLGDLPTDEEYNQTASINSNIIESKKELQLLRFEYGCRKMIQRHDKITKYLLIKFLCENIPLNFSVKLYGETAVEIIRNQITKKSISSESNIQPDVLFLFVEGKRWKDENFIPWMKKVFNDSFYETENTKYCLQIGHITLEINFICKYSRNKSPFLEHSISLGPCSCVNPKYCKCVCKNSLDSTDAKSKLCDLQILYKKHWWNTNLLDHLISLKNITNNLKNNILTIIWQHHDSPPVWYKLYILDNVYQAIMNGYTVIDPWGEFPGLSNIIINTHTTKDIFQIINIFIRSSDLCKITIDYIGDNIIDPDDVCFACDKKLIIGTYKKKIQSIRPLIIYRGIKTISQPLVDYHDPCKKICLHGFDDGNGKTNLSVIDTNKVILHRSCFIRILKKHTSKYYHEKYPTWNDIDIGCCPVCKNYFI